MQNRARFASCVHIRNHRAGFRLADDCPDRYFDDEVFTALARAVACRAVHTVFRRVFALEAEVQQRVHVQVGVKADIAAVAAVSAVRPAVQDEFFPVDDMLPLPPLPALQVIFTWSTKLPIVPPSLGFPLIA